MRVAQSNTRSSDSAASGCISSWPERSNPTQTKEGRWFVPDGARPHGHFVIRGAPLPKRLTHLPGFVGGRLQGLATDNHSHTNTPTQHNPPPPPLIVAGPSPGGRG